MPFYKRNKVDIPRSRIIEKSTHKNGLRHNIFSPEGTSYRGEWMDDRKHGKGAYRSKRSRIVYEGDFQNNLFHGDGVVAFQVWRKSDSSQTIRSRACREVRVYRGTFVNGKMAENGLRIFKNGSYYLGGWEDGKRHGFGQIWYADGSWYAGDWVNGNKEGVGIYVKPNGNRYEGTFFQNLRHGKGKFYFLNYGQVQEGVWYKDNCTVCTFKNIQFRQAATSPTKYPLPKLTLIEPDRIYKSAQDKILKEQKPSCELLDLRIESLLNIKKTSVIISQ